MKKNGIKLITLIAFILATSFSLECMVEAMMNVKADRGFAFVAFVFLLTTVAGIKQCVREVIGLLK